MCFISGCATQQPVISPPPISGTQEVSLKYLCEKHHAFCQWESLDQVVTISLGGELAKVLVGSDIVLLDEKTVFLNRPVQMRNGAVKVSSDFETKIFGGKEAKVRAPLKGKYFLKKIRKIVIDAGHGGKDPGTLGRGGSKEKYIVMDISKRLEKILKKRGIDVIMTRRNDTFVSLKKRTEIASRSNADIFVSVHANSSPSRGVQGVEVFSLKNLSILEKNEEQRKVNHKLLLKSLDAKAKSSEVEDIIAEMLYVYKQGESAYLAEKVAKKTASFVKVKNRGAKHARFYVLRNTLIPAILVEVGFLSNPREERLLKTKAYRQKLAEGLARSLLDYAQ